MLYFALRFAAEPDPYNKLSDEWLAKLKRKWKFTCDIAKLLNRSTDILHSEPSFSVDWRVEAQ